MRWRNSGNDTKSPAEFADAVASGRCRPGNENMYVALIGYSDASHAERVRAFISDLPAGTIPHMKTMHEHVFSRERPFEISSYEHSGLSKAIVTNLATFVIPRARECGLGALFDDAEESVTGITPDIVTRQSALARALPLVKPRVAVVDAAGKATSRSKLSAAEKDARYNAHLTLWGCYECVRCNTRGLGSLELHRETCAPHRNLSDEVRVRLDTVLDTARAAVVPVAPDTDRVNFINPVHTFAGVPGYGRAERRAAVASTLSADMVADIKAQPERRNATKVLEHLRALNKYPELEWIQTDTVKKFLAQLGNQESRAAAGGVHDLVRISKGPGGLVDVVKALSKWYVKDMKAALVDVFKLSDAGTRDILTNRIATAVVSGGDALLAAEVAAAVALDAAAAAAPADAAADVPMDPAGAPGAAAVDDAPMAPVADAVFAAPSDGGCRHALTMVCSSHALVRSRCCGTPV